MQFLLFWHYLWEFLILSSKETCSRQNIQFLYSGLFSDSSGFSREETCSGQNMQFSVVTYSLITLPYSDLSYSPGFSHQRRPAAGKTCSFLCCDLLSYSSEFCHQRGTAADKTYSFCIPTYSLITLDSLIRGDLQQAKHVVSVLAYSLIALCFLIRGDLQQAKHAVSVLWHSLWELWILSSEEPCGRQNLQFLYCDLLSDSSRFSHQRGSRIPRGWH